MIHSHRAGDPRAGPAARSVLRWGRSAYETDADLAAERAGAESLGLAWRSWPTTDPPPLDGVGALVTTSGVRVDERILASFRGDLVLTTTSGFDPVDVDAVRARGIRLARLPQARRDAVVEWSLAALIALLRRVPALQDHAAAGRWARPELPDLAPLGLQGSTVAVVGVGVIGRKMAEALTVLGARVVGVDPAGVPPGIDEMDLDGALSVADAVTLHCSLGPTSRGLLSAERLDLLKPRCVLVNSARGDVLDVDDAAHRVADGRLRGLAVDVFPREPWHAMDSAKIPGIWYAPHAAGFTADLGARVAVGVNSALEAWASGGVVPYEVP